jgi:transcriptional regulator with XRE-family HTH domain
MEIKDRLIRIITSEGLTSTAFADSIGVQRSSISHIISGRNKPSLDFLQKILASFPKYNAEWLVMGIGDIYKLPTQANLFDELPQQSNPSKVDAPINDFKPSEPDELTTTYNPLENVLNDENKPSYDTPKQQLEAIKTPLDKKIHKIVLFYSDKTFLEYQPE